MAWVSSWMPLLLCLIMTPCPPSSTLFPYTTLFRSEPAPHRPQLEPDGARADDEQALRHARERERLGRAHDALAVDRERADAARRPRACARRRSPASPARDAPSPPPTRPCSS